MMLTPEITFLQIGCVAKKLEYPFSPYKFKNYSGSADFDSNSSTINSEAASRNYLGSLRK